MKDKRAARKQRHLRIRKDISGTPNRPRLCVNRSLKHMYAQVIDDVNGVTIAAASTNDAEIRDEFNHGGNKEAARAVGELVAKRCLDEGVEEVVFDRGGNKYHGRVKALAEGARDKGLKF